MGEKINYCVQAKNFQSESELDEFANLCNDFDEGGVLYDFNEEKNHVTAWFKDGWRGGGKSCEEIVKDHFVQWLNKHPHIEFTSSADYIDQSPIAKAYDRNWQE